MEGSASPRNPSVAIDSRSSEERSFEVACRSKAMIASSRVMPSPSSRTRINCLPPVSTSILILQAQASSAFSSNSFTTDEGRSTTSPAAILLARASGRTLIFDIGGGILSQARVNDYRRHIVCRHLARWFCYIPGERWVCAKVLDAQLIDLSVLLDPPPL